MYAHITSFVEPQAEYERVLKANDMINSQLTWQTDAKNALYTKYQSALTSLSGIKHERDGFRTRLEDADKLCVQLRDERNDFAKDADKLRVQCADTNRHNDRLREDYARLSKAHGCADKTIADLRAEVSRANNGTLFAELRDEAGKARKDLAIMTESRNHNATLVHKLRDELTRVNSRNTSNSEAVGKLRDEVSELERQIDNLKSENVSLTNELRTNPWRTERDSFASQLNAKITEGINKDRQIAMMGETIKDKSTRMDDLKSDNNALNNELIGRTNTSVADTRQIATLIEAMHAKDALIREFRRALGYDPTRDMAGFTVPFMEAANQGADTGPQVLNTPNQGADPGEQVVNTPSSYANNLAAAVDTTHANLVKYMTQMNSASVHIRRAVEDLNKIKE